MKKDVLKLVHQFVVKYAQRPDLPELTPDRVVVGWQNVVNVLPPDCEEYAVITYLAAIRHGTNVRSYTPVENEDTGIIEKVQRLAEHMVQIDFCCARPLQAEASARLRAELVEMLTREHVAVDFYKAGGFSALYADDPRPLPFQSEAEQWVARYSVTLHLSGWTAVDVPLDSFEDVNIHVENVDVHHPVTE